MVKKLSNIIALSFLFMVSNALATPVPVSGVIDTVSGAGMTGMSVSAVTDRSNSPEAISWGALSNGNFGVEGTGWELVLSDSSIYAPFNSMTDTYLSTWVLAVDSQTTLESLSISGINSNIIFDIYSDYSPDHITPDSGHGFWSGNMDDSRTAQQRINKTTNSSQDTWAINDLYKWTFSDEISIAGDPNSPYGDLYGNLELDFTITENGTSSGFTDATTTFFLDTDYAVPEPSSVLLLGMGLLGLGAIARRRT